MRSHLTHDAALARIDDLHREAARLRRFTEVHATAPRATRLAAPVPRLRRAHLARSARPIACCSASVVLAGTRTAPHH
jgi:hypothetical protein